MHAVITVVALMVLLITTALFLLLLFVSGLHVLALTHLHGCASMLHRTGMH